MNYFKSGLIGLLIAIITVSCEREPVAIKLLGIKNDIATFTVKNISKQDIYSMSFEITYYSSEQVIIKVDTVNYAKTTNIEGNHIPFIKAEGETLIAQTIPHNTASASAIAIAISYTK